MTFMLKAARLIHPQLLPSKKNRELLFVHSFENRGMSIIKLYHISQHLHKNVSVFIVQTCVNVNVT